LSVEADQERLICVEEAATPERLVGTEGAVGSGVFGFWSTGRLIVKVAVEMLLSVRPGREAIASMVQVPLTVIGDV